VLLFQELADKDAGAPRLIAHKKTRDVNRGSNIKDYLRYFISNIWRARLIAVFNRR
jgi:hypothetical protein